MSWRIKMAIAEALTTRDLTTDQLSEIVDVVIDLPYHVRARPDHERAEK